MITTSIMCCPYTIDKNPASKKDVGEDAIIRFADNIVLFMAKWYVPSKIVLAFGYYSFILTPYFER